MSGGGPVVLVVERDPVGGFLALDEELLARSAAVGRLRYPGRPTVGFVLETWRAVGAADVVYAFFASEHTLWPVVAAALRKRRVVLVPAGYDYAHLPERRYGLRSRGLGIVPWLIGRLADVALPISTQTLWEFLDLVPSAAPRTRLGLLTVDPAAWDDPGVERDPDLVVTLAHVDAEAWSRKGIDRFVAAAAADPTRRYVLAGAVAPDVAATHLAAPPPNLELPGRLDHDALRRLFWSASVYVQLSWHETFGVAMAEAMVCGAVPVISPSPALGEVAGPWAVVVPDGGGVDDDVAGIAAGAARSASLDRAAQRADVLTRFDCEARADLLAAAVRGDALPATTPRSDGPGRGGAVVA